MKNFYKVIFFVILLICLGYLYIVFTLMIPYFEEFINGSYLIENVDLPTYSNVFDSIFDILGILVTAYFSYSVYKLSSNQEKDSYNREIASSANIVYYQLKFGILYCLNQVLEDNKSILKDGEYDSINGKVKAKEYILNAFKGTYRFTNLEDTRMILLKLSDYYRFKTRRIKIAKLKEYGRNICLNEDTLVIKIHKLIHIYKQSTCNKRISKGLVTRLHALGNDILTLSEANKLKNLSYVFNEQLIDINDDGIKLIEKRSEKWAYIIHDIYNDEWKHLDPYYQEIMKELFRLSSPK